MSNLLMIKSGRGTIQIEAQPNTLLVAYYADPSSPANVLYANGGGTPDTPLPEGDSTYQVTGSFAISYDLGNCPLINIGWVYE